MAAGRLFCSCFFCTALDHGWIGHESVCHGGQQEHLAMEGTINNFNHVSRDLFKLVHWTPYDFNLFSLTVFWQSYEIFQNQMKTHEFMRVLTNIKKHLTASENITEHLTKYRNLWQSQRSLRTIINKQHAKTNTV